MKQVGENEKRSDRRRAADEVLKEERYRETEEKERERHSEA